MTAVLKLAVGAALVLSALTSAAASQAGSTGTLSLNAALTMTSTPSGCSIPPQLPPDAFCAVRSGNGVVSGLGRVSHAYTFYALEGHECGTGFRLLETAVLLEIVGKGTLELAANRDEDCVSSALIATRTFTITGGAGLYAGASGGGSVEHNGRYQGIGATGTDTWSGTLSVSGHEFDVTAPTLSGAVNKTVRAPRKAKRVRVTYRVTARDNVDGAVPVNCKPRSGSRFRIGRTVVKCTAMDASGNTRAARFVIRVKPRRA